MKLEDFSPEQRRKMKFSTPGYRADVLGQPDQPKPSKYRNVKVVTPDGVFDSKRECQYWQELKLREKAGDITELDRQVTYPLYCPTLSESEPYGGYSEVATYIADFCYVDCDGIRHTVDAKGKRTPMYLLKRKWLALQSGIEIEEV